MPAALYHKPGLPPTTGKTLTIIRHGSTVLNDNGKNRGWADVPLDENGKEEAVKLGKQLKNSGIDLLVPSDLIRAKQTAAIISEVADIPVAPSTRALRPLDIGELSGKNIKDTLAVLQYYMKNRPDDRLPGGESFNEFKNRAIQGLKDLVVQYPHKNLGLVTHHRIERLTDAYLKAGINNDGIHIEEMMKKGAEPGTATIHNLNNLLYNNTKKMTPAEIIAQASQRKFINEGDSAVRGFMDAKIREMTERALAETLPLIQADAERIVEEMIASEIARLTADVKKGDNGLQGEPGEAGEKGEKGEVGPKGENGKPGRDGKDGINGKNGEPGQDGQNGLNGSPDTAEDIVKKLNTTSEMVDFSVIRGLKTWMSNVQRSIKEKSGGGKVGGGMGNWIHESIVVNSATTFVTTTTAIAADGFAIFAFYQGGMIARGSAYTVSGRQQLNLLFTPQDNTTIDIIYVRT